MAEYLAKSEDLTAVADAIRAKGGTDAQLTFPDGFVGAVQAIPAGTTITDGIVVKARDSQHRPTAIEYFGEYVSAQSLGSPNGKVGFGAGLSSATFHGTVYVADEAFKNDANLISITGLFENIGHIGADAFNGCAALEMEIALPAGVTYGLYPFQKSGIKKFFTLSSSAITRAFCLNCNKLVHFSAVNVSAIDQSALANCTALAEVTLGSIGHAITTLNNSAFSGDTQTGLTITVYTTSAYADTALSNIRNGATNATIIIKASEDTTYNGTAYSAGDTIITSTPEAST